MHVQVACVPSRRSADDRPRSAIRIRKVNCQSIRAFDVLPDVRNTNEDGPRSGLDRARKVAVTGRQPINMNVIPTPATPPAESVRTAKAEINHGPLVSSRIRNVYIDLPGAGLDVEWPFEQSIEIGGS